MFHNLFGVSCYRYQYREGSGCKEASTHHRAEGEGKVAHPSDTLVLRLVSLLNSPEEYLCMVRGRLLFPPYAVPMDTKDGDESK